MPTLEDTLQLALRAHAGQKDKYGQPYILHPLRVMARMDTEAEQTVALLHDVVEDSDYTLDNLREQGYSEDIVVAVDALSKREGEDYFVFVQRAMANPLARRVKQGDLEDNMDIRRMPEINEDAHKRLNRYLKAWAMVTESFDQPS
jgi:(p)ppGpp synthase/HD superfamily hydrolase